MVKLASWSFVLSTSRKERGVYKRWDVTEGMWNELRRKIG